MPKMLLFVFVLLLLLLTGNAWGQLSGIRTIPGDYPTIAAAVDALNTHGVGTGGVTFNVAAGHTETITVPIHMTATGTAANQIVFQRSGTGANPLITGYGGGTATPATVGATHDGIWRFIGSDWVTVDGIDLTDPNTANPATMEYGFAFYKASATNGCNNNTIRNCVITLQRVNNAAGAGPSLDGSKGINLTNSLFGTPTVAVTITSVAGASSNNRFLNNTIRHTNLGIVLVGFAAASPFTLADAGNRVESNSIINFGGGGIASSAAAVRTQRQYSLNVLSNIINNNDGGGANHAITLRGIFIEAATSASLNCDLNDITLNGGGTTCAVIFIENGAGSIPAGNTVNINNNTLTGNYLTATKGAFRGIFNNGATPAILNIQNNNISKLSYSAAALTGTGVVYPIHTTGSHPAMTINATGNTISNITRTGSTGGSTRGILIGAGTDGMVINTNNNIVTGMSIAGAGTASVMRGIETPTGTITMNNNQIDNLTVIKTTGTGAMNGIRNSGSPSIETYNNNIIHTLTHNGTGTVRGIHVSTTAGTRTMSGNLIHTITGAGTTITGIHSGASAPNIFNNKIYNLTSTATGAPVVSGILMASLSSGATANIYNNFIGDLNAPSAGGATAAAPTVRGINITATSANTNVNLFYNTVYLDATSTGTNFGTATLFAEASTTATTVNLTLANNIFANNSVSRGVGRTVAYQRTDGNLANYHTTSNNNLFFAGTPGGSNLIFFDGTNSDPTIDAFKARVAPRETVSFSENPVFQNTSGASPDYLKISLTVPTQIESGGRRITSPVAITTDFFGTVRALETGYTGSGTAPDIGAFEGEMSVPMPPTPISGTKTIPGDYPTIAAAVDALNTHGVGTGGVTFNVAAGHTETITAPIHMTATGTAANPIVFQRSGIGANPLITAYGGGTATPATVGATHDGIWRFIGSDWVTVDGIDLTDPNTANPATMEYGFAFYKASATNGCNNNTIRNCVITLQRVNNAAGAGPSLDGSKGINLTNSLFPTPTATVTITSVDGASSNNRFFKNTIQHTNLGIVLVGFATASPFTLVDAGNRVEANTILNFGGGGTDSPAAAVRTQRQYSLNVLSNIINNNDGGGVNHATTLRGILIEAATSASLDCNLNDITLNGGGTTTAVIFIENGAGSIPAGNTVNINNNTLTGNYLTATSGTFRGIRNNGATPATLNILNNTISNLSYSAAALAGSGVVYPIHTTGSNSAMTINANGNTISNITRTGSTGGTTRGIFIESGAGGMAINTNNNIISGMSIAGAGTASVMRGIETPTGTITMNNNQINNLTVIKTTGTDELNGIRNSGSPTIETYNNNIIHTLTHNGTGTVRGIHVSTTAGTRTMSGNLIHTLTGAGTEITGINSWVSAPNIFNNKIYNITSTATGAPVVSGILMGSLSSGATANIYNNFIGDLKAPSAGGAAVTAPTVRGINITATDATTNVNLFYNTVYLDATSTGTNFGTTALFAQASATATTVNLTLANNIFTNNSVSNGVGRTVAYQRTDANLANYHTTSNNNLFFAGTPGGSNLIFFDSTNSDQTIDAFKARVAPSESVSFSENPVFQSTVGSSPDYLKISLTVPTLIESGGRRITSPVAITTDFFGTVRALEAGYTGTGIAPDIGAFEGEMKELLLDIPSTQTFDAAAFPVKWRQTYAGAITSDRWSVSNTNFAGGTPHEMLATKQNQTGTSRLIVGRFNTAGIAALSLSFRMLYDDFGTGCTMKIQSSPDGVTWTDEAFSFASGGGNISPTVVNTTILQNLGAETLIAWVIDGDHMQFDYWYIDNVEVGFRNTWTGATSTDWAIAANWTLGVPLAAHDVVIPDVVNKPVISTAATVSNLIIDAGATLNIAPTGQLTVTGNLTNNGTLTIQSTAAATGSLITTGAVTGNIRVERHLPSATLHYISSPVDLSATNFGAIFPGGAGNPVPRDFYRWAENFVHNAITGWWFNIKHHAEWTTTSFVPGRGYAITYAAPSTTITLTGSPYNANQSITMTRTAGARHEAWNLVGNPFSATVAANNPAQATNNLIAANTAVLDGSFTGVYFWDNTVSDYRTITHASAATRIQPGQAFMVKTAANNNTFALNTNKRIHGEAIFYKTENDPVRVTLRVDAPENGINKTELVFLDGMTAGLDQGYDAGKLQGNPNLSLFTRLVECNGEKFAVQALPLSYENTIVNIGLYAGIAGEYRIGLDDQSTIPATVPVILEDRQLGVFTNLHEVDNYAFTVGTAGEIENRFYLHFKAVGIYEPAGNVAPIAYTIGNMLYIVNHSAEISDVSLFTIHGKQADHFRVSGRGIHTRTLHLPTGIYIVRMSNESGVVSAKVLVK